MSGVWPAVTSLGAELCRANFERQALKDGDLAQPGSSGSYVQVAFGTQRSSSLLFLLNMHTLLRYE